MPVQTKGLVRCAVLTVVLVQACYYVSVEVPHVADMFEAGYFDAKVKGKTMVVYAMKDLEIFDLRAQGMFQDFFSVIGAIKHGLGNGAHGVRVYYDTAYYANRTGDNYWAYFFEPSINLLGLAEEDEESFRHTLPDVEEVHFNSFFGRFGMLGSFTSVAIGRRGDIPFPIHSSSCGEECGVRSLGHVVKKYVKVKETVTAKVDEFTARHFDGKFVIGVQYRGTDKRGIRDMGRYQTFSDVVRSVVLSIPPEYGDRYVIFVATDEEGALRYFLKKFGADRVVYVAESTRMPDSAKDSLGGAHKSTRFAPYLKGFAAIVDVLLLSKAHHIIRNRSSVSSVAMLFSTHSPVVHSYVISGGSEWSTVPAEVRSEFPQVRETEEDMVLHFHDDAIIAVGTDYPPKASRAVLHSKE